MKIGFVFDDSLDRNDGVQQYIKTLGKWMSGNDHEVRYLVGETKDAGEFQPYCFTLAKNLRVRFNKNRLSIPLPASKQQISKVLTEEQFDVLHVQAPFSPMLAARIINAAPPKTGVVATFHIVGDGFKENFGLKLLKLTEQKALKRVHEYLAVSSAAVRASQVYFPDIPLVSPNVVDIKKYKFRGQRNIKRAKKLKIIFLGRLVERKGVHHLIDALVLLKKREIISKLEVKIAGDGPDRTFLQTKVRDAGLSSVVSFLGMVDESVKPELLAEADLAVFPSTSGESFGIVLIEAMAVGTLTLGGRNPGYATVLDGPKEMLVNPRNRREFARRLEDLLTDDDLRRKLYQWQRERIGDFDVETVGPKLLDHYRAAIRHAITLSNGG
jgi:phosphatidylinositol alpha-mannosyltransferase